MSLVVQLMSLFDRRERISVVAICTLMVVVAFLEVVGIGMILPFISMLSDPQLTLKQPSLRTLYEATGAQSVHGFQLFLALALFGVYVVKNVIAGLLGYLMSKFAFDKQSLLSRELLRGYLMRPYIEHFGQNTAQMTRNVLSEVGKVVNGILLPMLTVITEALVLAFILIFLIVVEPVVSISAFTMVGLAAGAIQLGLKRPISSVTLTRLNHYTDAIKWMNQSFGAFKEIKAYGREDYFVDRFGSGIDAFCRSERIFSTLNSLPRLLLELTFIGGILIVIALLLLKGSNLVSAIPVLAVFAVAATRIMPSANRILSAVNVLRYSRPALDELCRDLPVVAPQASKSVKTKKTAASPPVPSRFEALVIEDVCFRYPGADGWAVKGISLRIPHGSSLGLFGRSGSGKSTLVELIVGLFEPQAGVITVDGVSIPSLGALWQEQIGYVPQAIYLLDDTVQSNIAFGQPDRLIDSDRVWAALDLARAAEFVHELPQKLQTVIGEGGQKLSGGQRQRLGIARALYHRPSLLVLDEATSALDGLTENEVRETLAGLSEKVTIIIIAHRISTIMICDQVAHLDGGRLLAVASFEQLFDTDLQFRKLVQSASHGT